KQKGEKITMPEFNQIQIGMSYEQVKEIFKRDGLLKSETNIMGTGSRLISWINSDGSNAIITFGPNGVDSKTQTNLK
ncbi:beta-lactamase-inhibitor protein BLIP, partial [Megasphaera sp. BL7]